MSLPHSEALDLLTSISRELICLHEEDGKYIFVSPSSERIIGYKPEELIGRSPYEFFHPDDILIIRERSHKPILLGTEGVVTTFRFRHKNGEYIWLHSKNRLIAHEKSGNKFIHTASIDITEKHDTEINLANAEKRFKDLFYSSPIGLVITKGDGYLDDVNPAFAEFLGYKPWELLGKHFQTISDDAEKMQNFNLKKAVELGERDSYSLEKQYIHKNGSRLWALVTVTAFREDDGTATTFIAQIIDINERKKNEQILNQTNENLKHITTSLLRQNQQILSFNQIVSHHLRAPISNLRSIIQLLSETNDLDEKKELEAHLGKITDSLDSIMDDLIATIKIQKTDAHHSSNLDLNEIFKLSATILKDEIEDHHVKIETSFEDAPIVHFPKEFLLSIFTNLILNSIKYADKNRPPHITVKSYTNNSYIEIVFSDNGIGIDLERYGNQVFQLRKTFHKNSSGKGLGLFLIRYKMETMGGKVDIKSELGKGTSLFLQIPIPLEEL